MPVRLNGSTSGYVELGAPAVAGTTVLELPTDSIKPGMVLVAAQSFSAVSSVSVNNCFTSTYANYLVILDAVASATTFLQMRMRASGSDNSGTNHDYSVVSNTFNGTNLSTSTNEAGGSFWRFAQSFASGRSMASITLYGPQLSLATGFSCHGLSPAQANFSAGILSVTTSYDGLTLFPSTGTMTGNVRIYGLRNS